MASHSAPGNSAAHRRVRRVVRHLTSESALASALSLLTSVPESALHAGHLVSQVLKAHGVEFVFCLSVRFPVILVSSPTLSGLSSILFIFPFDLHALL